MAASFVVKISCFAFLFYKHNKCVLNITVVCKINSPLSTMVLFKCIEFNVQTWFRIWYMIWKRRHNGMHCRKKQSVQRNKVTRLNLKHVNYVFVCNTFPAVWSLCTYNSYIFTVMNMLFCFYNTCQHMYMWNSTLHRVQFCIERRYAWQTRKSTKPVLCTNF